MWQKCPICNGSGKMFSNLNSSSISGVSCDVCNGAKIISEINGLPPNNIPEQNKVILNDLTKTPKNPYVNDITSIKVKNQSEDTKINYV